MSRNTQCFAVFLLLPFLINCADVCKTWTVKAKDDYMLCSKIEGDEVVMDLTVKTTGWIGFGIAEQTGGSMHGSDMAIIEWANGEPKVSDRFATAKATPHVDSCGEDWTISGFKRAGGVTTGTLRRSITVEDTNEDRPFVKGSMRIVIAYGEPGQDTLAYHGAGRSVATMTFMKGGEEELTTPETDLVTVKLLNKNYTVGGKRTIYTCYAFDMLDYLPDLADRDYHVVSYDIEDTSVGNPNYQFHHSLLYETTENHPFYFRNNESVNTCSAQVHAAGFEIGAMWAVGTNKVVMPREAGLRVSIDPSRGWRYIVMNSHYDVPSEMADAGVDASGFVLELTKTLRKHDVQILNVGDTLAQIKDIIKPGTTKEYQTMCSAECTNNTISEPLNVFSITGHMHLFGREQRTSVWRDGKEVHVLEDIEYWDFNLQLNHPVKAQIMAGDEIHSYCKMVNDGNVDIGFGDGTDSEMCMAFIHVYPKKGLRYCGYLNQKTEICKAPDNSGYLTPKDKPPHDLFDIVDPVDEQLFGNTSAPCPENCKTWTVKAKDDYMLCSKIEGDEVVMDLTVKTTGWIGFGIAEQTGGSMHGSDMAIIEWANGEPKVSDRFATAKATPHVDSCGEDWTISGFKRAGGVTTGTLRRSITVEDTNEDRPFVKGSMRIVIAYGEPGQDTLAYHGAGRSVATMTFMKGGEEELTTPETDLVTVKLLNKNYTVGGKRTIYTCYAFDMLDYLPDLADRDYHVVSYDIEDTSVGNPNYQFHHSLLYETTENHPFYFRNNESVNTCSAQVHAAGFEIGAMWAVGTNKVVMPREAGLRVSIDPSRGWRYIVMNSHYDVPSEMADAGVDASGFVLELTKTLRKHDVQILNVGDTLAQIKDIIKPGTTKEYQTMCSAECTNNTISEPLNVFSITGHMHLFGREQRTSVWRDGKEVHVLEDIEYWDFNLQLNHPVKAQIMAGDEIHSYCKMVNDGNVDIGFGDGTDSEMCMAFIHVYPKKGLRYCGYLNQKTEICKAPDNSGYLTPKDKPPHDLFDIVDPVDEQLFGNTSAPCPENCKTWTVKAKDDYMLCSKIEGDEVVMDLTVKTTGWIGFGIAEQTGGSMHGSDMAIIEWANGEPKVSDRFATAKATPHVDSCGEDWTISGFKRAGGVTTGTLRRSITVEDTNEDRPFVKGSMRIVIAYGEPGQDTLAYHGAGRSVATMTFMKGGEEELTTPETDLVTVKLLNKNYTVGGKRTIYTCYAFDMLDYLPDLADRDYHVVSYDIEDTSVGNPNYQFHHSLLYETTENHPFYFRNNESVNTCSAQVHAAGFEIGAMWAVGTNKVVMPREAGLRVSIDPSRGWRYIVMNSHYDVPSEMADAGVDASGFVLELTKTLRKHDVQILNVGDTLAQIKDIIKPGTTKEYQTMCSAECTNNTISEPLNVFSITGHMHLFGREQRTSVWRDGKEVHVLEDIEYWDFNLQLNHPVKAQIMAGDEIHSYCKMVNDGNVDIGFGDGTDSEMCMAFIHVYPKKGLRYCGYLNQKTEICKAPDNSGYLTPKDKPPHDLFDIVDPVDEQLFGNTSAPCPENCKTWTVKAKDDYMLCSKIEGDEVVMDLTVKTTGWIGFGIAEQTGGSMHGSDMAIIEWANGEPKVSDRFATAKATPHVDSCGEDWTISGFKRAGGVTTGTLRRSITVEDTNEDRPFVKGSMRIVIAYGEPGQDTLAYHGAGRSVATMTFMKGGEEELTTPETDLVTVKLLNKNYTVGGKRTIYTCYAFDMLDYLPDLADRDYHVVSYDIEDTSVGNPNYQFHHSLLYETTENHPFYFRNNESVNTCSAQVHAAGFEIGAMWAVGTNKVVMPREAGLRVSIDPSRGWRYIVMNSHYDVPSEMADAGVDASGFVLELTKTLRKHDVQILNVGDTLAQIKDIIKPGTTKEYQTMCSAECTNNTISEPLNVFSITGHMHLFGREQRTSVWRDGKEVHVLEDIEYWDFNLQLNHPVKAQIMAGDEIHSYCKMVNDGNVDIGFGDGTDSEMCMAFIHVYPKKGLRYCGYLNQKTEICKAPDNSGYLTPKDKPPHDLFDIVDPVDEQLFGNTSLMCAANNCKSWSLQATDDYKICSNVVRDVVELSVTVKTTGWIGFGISDKTNHGMIGSDMVVVEWADGIPVVSDRYASMKALPALDESKADWRISGFKRSNGVTTGNIVRSITSSNEKEDRAFLLTETMPIVLAYGADGDDKITYHGPSRRTPTFMTLHKGTVVETEVPLPVNTTTEAPETQSPPASCPTPSTRTGYTCMVKLDTTTEFNWVEMPNGELRVLVVFIGVPGYGAIGFPKEKNRMVGSKVVATNGKFYDLNGKSTSEVVETAQLGDFTDTTTGAVREVAVQQTNGNSEVTFTTGKKPSLNMVVAYHKTASFPAAQHEVRFGASITTTTGGAVTTLVKDNSKKVKAHGTAMVTVWAYVVPMAVAVKRFGGKHLGSIKSVPIAFIVHAVLMLGSMVATTVFFSVALYEFENETSHRHKEIGIVLLVVGWCQVVIGVIGVLVSKPQGKHRLIFKVLHSLMGITVFAFAVSQMATGIVNIGDLYSATWKDNLTIAVIVGLAFCFLLFVVLSLVVGATVAKDEDAERGDDTLEGVKGVETQPY